MNKLNFRSSHPRSVPNTLRTAVKLTTLGVNITAVRRDEVKRRRDTRKLDVYSFF